METSLEYFQEYLAIFQAIFDVNLYIDTVLFVRRRESSIALLAVLGFQHWWSKMLACCILYRLVLFLNKILSFRDTLDTRCVQFPAFSFFLFFFFFFFSFFLARVFPPQVATVHALLTTTFDQVFHEQCIRTLFTDSQILLFSNFFNKNGSHGTIHIFKNYFVTVFSVFSFSKISSIQTEPYS